MRHAEQPRRRHNGRTAGIAAAVTAAMLGLAFASAGMN
jgi:hypothetical protein